MEEIGTLLWSSDTSLDTAFAFPLCSIRPCFHFTATRLVLKLPTSEKRISRVLLSRDS